MSVAHCVVQEILVFSYALIGTFFKCKFYSYILISKHIYFTVLHNTVTLLFVQL
jgi:hypothetical protein